MNPKYKGADKTGLFVWDDSNKTFIALSGTPDGKLEVSVPGVVDATTVTEYNITLTSADTEYSQALPSDTKAVAFKGRDYAPIRYSYTTGKVATPIAPYSTLDAGQAYNAYDIDFTGKTLYFASSNAGDVVELIVLT